MDHDRERQIVCIDDSLAWLIKIRKVLLEIITERGYKARFILVQPTAAETHKTVIGQIKKRLEGAIPDLFIVDENISAAITGHLLIPELKREFGKKMMLILSAEEEEKLQKIRKYGILAYNKDEFDDCAGILADFMGAKEEWHPTKTN